MRKKLLIIALLLVCAGYSIACTCFPAGKKEMVSFFREVDYVVTGRAVENLHSVPEMREFQKKQEYGELVIFEVDSVLKGPVRKGEKLLIIQFHGNCSRTFKMGAPYLIFGSRVLEVYNPQNPDLKKDLAPPPAEEFSNCRLAVHIADEGVAFLNEKIKNHTAIRTGECESFRLGTDYGDRVIGYLKD